VHVSGLVKKMDDIFTDGRKVAPAVIGEDPTGQGGS
jgi:hypothetical protein